MLIETKKELLKLKSISNKDIFEYEYLEVEQQEIYKDFYRYFSELLDKYSAKKKLGPSYFYIDNGRTCNAAAAFKQNTNLIKISSAYPRMLRDKFIERETFEKDLILKHVHKDLFQDKNFQLNDFILKSSITFTFHHEFRHLLQFNGEESSSSETPKNVFDFEKHMMEFDADRIGCLYVMDYAFDEYENLNIKSGRKFESLLYIGLGSIIITYLLYHHEVIDNYQEISIKDKKDDFYIEKKSHPHTLVRLDNIIDFFDKNVEENYKLKIPKVNYLKYSLELVNIYFRNLNADENKLSSPVKDYFDEYSKNIEEIMEYNQKLFENIIKHPKLSKIIEQHNRL